jgi:hypothetical protein
MAKTSLLRQAPEWDERLRAIEDALADVTRRLSRLEASQPLVDSDAAGDTGASHTVTSAAAVAAPGPRLPAGAASLAGRTIMVLGGAFLLRAITEAGSLPRSAGLTIGFVYGLAWFLAADRAATRDGFSALFHGVTALLITVAILWEATARFGAVGPWTAAAALGLVALLGLAVARHRHLVALAMLIVAGALATLAGLAVATSSPIPWLITALAIFVATTSLPADDAWSGLRWPAAAVTTLILLALLARSGGHLPLASPAAVVFLALLYAGVGLTAGQVRLLRQQRRPTAFDPVQTSLAIVVGLGGALSVSSRAAAGLDFGLGALVLLTAAGGYALALAIAEERPQHAAARLLFHQSLLAAFVGTLAVFDGPARTIWLGLVGAMLAWTGGRRLEPWLLAHGAVFVVAAALLGALRDLFVQTWLVTPARWTVLAPEILVVLVCAAFVLFGPRLPTGSPESRLTAASRLAAAAVVTVGVCTLVVHFTAQVVAGSPPDPGRLAVVRGVVLAVAVVLLALGRRAPRGRPLGSLVVPVLAVAGLRILADDLRHASTMQLFVSLAVYGFALRLGSRLRTRSNGEASDRGPDRLALPRR